MIPKSFAETLAALLSSIFFCCASQFPAQQTNKSDSYMDIRHARLGNGALGPLYIGMDRRTLEALPYKFRTSTFRAEDEEYIIDTVFVNTDLTVDAVFWDGKVTALTTRTRGYENQQGAKVGDTIERLQSIYPQGEIAKGNEEGPYFSFSTGIGGQIFRFDTNRIAYECLTQDRNCPPDIGKQKSTALSVR